MLGSLTADQLGEPRAYHNARYLLAAAATSPIPATATLGNLSRGFVERAVAEMRWPTAAPDVVRFVNKTLDEPDVPLLRSLREALQNGRMLRKYRGAFHATTRGRALLGPGREGELYLALFEAYLAPPDVASVDGLRPTGLRLQRGVPQLLWFLLETAGDTMTVGDLAEAMVAVNDTWPGESDPSFDQLSGALQESILSPLEELGLVEMVDPANGRRWRDEHEREVRVTPLFERFVIAAASLN
jgi:hypothetical protein